MQSGKTIIIKAGHLLRGEGFALQKDMAIVVKDGLIEDITPAGKLASRPGAEVMDFPELFLLPGLIDAHNHLSPG